MEFNELTAEEQAVLQNSVNYLFRETFATMAKLASATETVKNDWIGQSAAIMGKLADAAVIPNNSGMRGTQALTKEEVDGLVTLLLEFLSTWATDEKKEMYVTIAGAQQTLVIG